MARPGSCRSVDVKSVALTLRFFHQRITHMSFHDRMSSMETVMNQRSHHDGVRNMKNVFALLLLLFVPAIADAQQPSAAQIKFFETNIRPALVKYCYECHSVESGDSRGGLLVDTRMGLMQGGDAGPAIVPGDPEDSLLWEAITWEGYEMPPSQKMPAAVIANFKTWIEMGAPDPRVREITQFDTKITKQNIETARREHWSFQLRKTDSITSENATILTIKDITRV